MAGTANLSSTFSITVVPTDGNATLITNPGRTFKVLAVGVNNEGGATNVTVEKITGGVATNVAATQSMSANAFTFADITAANVNFTATDNVQVTSATAANTTLIEVICVAIGGGAPLTAV